MTSLGLHILFTVYDNKQPNFFNEANHVNVFKELSDKNLNPIHTLARLEGHNVEAIHLPFSLEAFGAATRLATKHNQRSVRLVDSFNVVRDFELSCNDESKLGLFKEVPAIKALNGVSDYYNLNGQYYVIA